MNVPSPAPCHVNVAGVGKQSVWGLRIIARSQLSLWHDSANPSMPESTSIGVMFGASGSSLLSRRRFYGPSLDYQTGATNVNFASVFCLYDTVHIPEQRRDLHAKAR